MARSSEHNGDGGMGVGGGSVGANVFCILRHRGVKLILAYKWARPAILVEVKVERERGGGGEGGEDVRLFFFVFFFLFIPVPLSSLSICVISSTISSISFLFLWETTQNDSQGSTCR